MFNLRKVCSRYADAVLVLESGTIFNGISIGSSGCTIAEIVFNTSITGYQEILTDPSYNGQIVLFTAPHIGNVGMNDDDFESNRIFASGLVVRSYMNFPSNFRSQCTLSDYLISQNIIGISEIDTRKLTRIIRNSGTQYACIATSITSSKAICLIENFIKNKSDKKIINTFGKNRRNWNISSWNSIKTDNSYHFYKNYLIVVFDFGVKSNILRKLYDLGCEILIVPPETSYHEIETIKPDGILLSNGPGNPEDYQFIFQTIRSLINKKFPIFGICLGCQLIALAIGSKTIKMKFGHHGANHPVKELSTGRVFITSQNHGYCIDQSTITNDIIVTHKSLFDKTIQGFELENYPVFGFQGHPEASPGPHDTNNLFLKFFELIRKAKI